MGAIMFRLGGQYREFSLAELVWRMGLYEEQDHMYPPFNIFLRLATQDYSPGVNGYGFWMMIENGAFNSGVSQKSHIWSPIHRLIHRIVKFSINHKKHGEKATNLNLIFMWSTIVPQSLLQHPLFPCSIFGGGGGI